MNVFVPDKDDAATLNWLLAACTKDDNLPVLKAIHVNAAANRIEAADGFRLHVARRPNCLSDSEFDNRLVLLTAPVQARKLNIYELLDAGLHFPDIDQVTPTGNPLWQWSVNPKYLAAALKGMADPTTLGFYGPYRPAKITDGDNLVVMMPMYPHDAAPMPIVPTLQGIADRIGDALGRETYALGRELTVALGTLKNLIAELSKT